MDLRILMTVKQRIDEFLDHRRFAIVGVSQKPRHFSRVLFSEFKKKGYQPVPVNPSAQNIDGQVCFASVSQVSPPVDTVLVMTPAGVTPGVVEDCAAAGVKLVWMYRATGAGAVNAEAIKACEAKGISVIPGECPMMFLPDSGLIHRFHGLIKKITRSYPN
jgi:predicted CoA-binding protein